MHISISVTFGVSQQDVQGIMDRANVIAEDLIETREGVIKTVFNRDIASVVIAYCDPLVTQRDIRFLQAVCASNVLLISPHTGIRGIALAALAQNGHLLRFATEELQDDDEAVSTALEESPDAVVFASARLQAQRTPSAIYSPAVEIILRVADQFDEATASIQTAVVVLTLFACVFGVIK